MRTWVRTWACSLWVTASTDRPVIRQPSRAGDGDREKAGHECPAFGIAKETQFCRNSISGHCTAPSPSQWAVVTTVTMFDCRSHPMAV